MLQLTKKHFSIFVIRRNCAYALFSIQSYERLSDFHDIFIIFRPTESKLDLNILQPTPTWHPEVRAEVDRVVAVEL